MVAALQAALDRHGSALTRANLATRLDIRWMSTNAPACRLPQRHRGA